MWLDARLKLVQTGVISVGEIGETQGMEVIAAIKLFKGVGVTDLNADGRIDLIATLIKGKVSCA